LFYHHGDGFDIHDEIAVSDRPSYRRYDVRIAVAPCYDGIGSADLDILVPMQA
jgi:hypothetical protein